MAKRFTLDTSGVVAMPAEPYANPDYGTWKSWADLDAFTQGYVEALFASLGRGLPGHCLTGLGFDDLAAETLAAILKDCAAYLADYGGAFSNAVERGRWFWGARQEGGMPITFPPAAPYLGEDGKVYLREAADAVPHA